MLDWIARHHEIISLGVNIGMLIVWVVYLQVFVGNYRRQTRPKILINRGAGSELDARCLVSNMSAEAIYIQSIIATLETSDDHWTSPVTELDGIEDWKEPSDLNLWTRQGPLLAGHVRNMGTFRAVLEHVLRSKAPGNDFTEVEEALSSFEIQIVATYGSEDLLSGAKRRFDVVRNGGKPSLHPHTVETEQIRSRRERKKIGRMLQDEL